MPTRISQGLLKLLTDLADYRMLSLSQVAFLHFRGKRAARRRTQQLEKDGLVDLLLGRSTPRGGRPENVYGISREGLKVLQTQKAFLDSLTFDQVGGERLSRQAGHQLLLNWCRLHLVHLAKTFPRVEYDFLACNSPLALDADLGLPIVSDRVAMSEDDSPVRFTPDAAYMLTDTQQPKSVLFFLEVDMGTEPVASKGAGNRGIQEKILRYQQYFRSKTYKRYEKIWGPSLNGFRLLFMTNSPSRLNSLCSVVRASRPSDFVWVASDDRMFAQGISGDIWVRGGLPDQAPESILDGLSRPAPLPELSE